MSSDASTLPPEPDPQPSRLARALPPVFSVIASSIAVYIALQLWNATMGIPFDYEADALVHAMHFEQIVQNGWIWNDSRLGAPFQQQMQDWPIGDLTSLGTAWLLSLFTDDWAVIQNWMFLISFPLTALSAWWVLTKFGLRSWTASVVGVLFTLLPYHFVRGEVHLFLSNYYVVPFGLYLAVRLLDSSSLFATNSRFSSRYLRYVSWRSAQTVAIAVFVGFGGIYYAVFTLLFIATALVIRFVTSRSVVPALVSAGAVIGAVLFATAPTIFFELQHGENPQGVLRNAFETEVWGLKLAHMLSPATGHRIPAFNNFQATYLDGFPLPAERGAAALGAIATLGLLIMLSVMIASLLRGASTSLTETRVRRFSMFSLVAFLVATIGGFSSFISILVTSNIRSWNRISVFIALCALAVVGLLLDALFRRFSAKRAVVGGALGALLCVGFLDQATPEFVPAYAATTKEFEQDERYFRTLESTLEPGAAVFNLPRIEFPEPPIVVGIKPTDEIIPYLQTDAVRWSFGAIKGRPESEWQHRIRFDSPNFMVEDFVATGYAGLLIDRDGYEDRGATLERSLQELLGVRPLVSEDTRYAFYDLRSYGGTLRATKNAQLELRKADLFAGVNQ